LNTTRVEPAVDSTWFQLKALDFVSENYEILSRCQTFVALKFKCPCPYDLGADWCLHTADTFFARALRDSNQLLWTGPGGVPDLGGRVLPYTQDHHSLISSAQLNSPPLL